MTIVTSLPRKIFIVLGCPDGYSDLVSGSDNCYKIVEDTINGDEMSWDRANDYCQDDNAMLACFNTQNERDVLAQYCYDENMAHYGEEYGCWVGYKYDDGESKKQL